MIFLVIIFHTGCLSYVRKLFLKYESHLYKYLFIFINDTYIAHINHFYVLNYYYYFIHISL